MPINIFLAVLLLAAGMPVAEAGSAANPEPAPAVQTDQPTYKFGGYGSLGFSCSSQSSGDYVLSDSMPKGAGRSGKCTESNNTRIAGHITAKFSPEVSAILQVDSEYQANGTYNPRLELVNVKYAFIPDFHMRIGRLALPTLLDSENHDIGYSYAWVNPPVDLYQLSIHSIDGVDAMYRSEIGEGVNSIKAVYGSRTAAKEMWGLFDKLEFGEATFQAGYQQRLSLRSNLLTGVAEAWVRSSDLSIGAGYDPGDWFVMSEWMQRRSIFKINAMYVSAGYRIEKFTPYLTYGQISPGSFLEGFPDPTATAVQRASRAQRTTSLGLRWDFARNIDCKVQYDRVQLGENSNGYLVNVPPGEEALHGSMFHVFSAVVDFVF